MFKLRTSKTYRALGIIAVLGAGGMWLSTGAQAASVDVPTAASCVDDTGDDSFACGDQATATGGKNTAVGDHAFADNTTGAAHGYPAGVGRDAAFGSHAEAKGFMSTAIGAHSYAGWTGDPADYGGNPPAQFADFTSAIGANSEAAKENATATGAEAHALGKNSTVNGAFSTAAFDNSAAFGAKVTTTRADQMKFGNTDNTYTMTGINSAASKAAQSGPTYFTTSDGAGNLATTSFSVTDLSNQVDRNTDGVAIALAAAGQNILPDGKHFAVSGGFGAFDGASALGLNGVAALGEGGLFVSGGLGVGLTTGAVGGAGHVTYAW